MYLNLFQQNIYVLESVDKAYKIVVITDAPFNKLLKILNKLTHDDNDLDEEKFQRRVEAKGYHLQYLDLTSNEYRPPLKVKRTGKIDVDVVLKKSRIEII
jgi:hypothetical protein